MAKTLTTAYHAGNFLSTASVSRYVPLGDCNIDGTNAVAEVARQATCRVPGTVSRLTAFVSTNTRPSDTVLTFRKNGSGTSLTLTIPANTTGTFEDVTNSVSLADGDTYSVEIATGTGVGNMLLAISAQHSVTSGAAKQLYASSATSFSTASTTSFIRPCGQISSSATETNLTTICPEAATLSNFSVYALSNARTTNTVIRIRKNEANGNQLVTFGSGVTGQLEDVTNTDTFAAGDRLTASVTTGTGTGTIQLTTVGVKFDTGNNRAPIMAPGTAGSSNTPRYVSPAGPMFDTATENQAQVPVVFSATLSRLYARVSANTTTTGPTVRSRIDAVDGNMSIAIGAGATGTFSDTSNTDTLSAGDLLDYSFSGHSGGTPTFRAFAGMLEEYTPPAGFIWNPLVGPFAMKSFVA